MCRLKRTSDILLLSALFVVGVLAQQPQPIKSSAYSPVLQVTSLRGFILENAEIGTTISINRRPQSDALQVMVTDQDLKPGMPPATYQYVLTGIGATIFAVDQRGYIYLNADSINADPPNPSVYQLTVQAREVNTIPVRSSQPVQIQINVIDTNDNGPVFDKQVYMATVDASVSRPRQVVRVVATDNDRGMFGRLTYRILSVTNNGQRLFRYDASSGFLVTTGGRLTPGERYQVMLEATDGGGRATRTVIQVDAAQRRQPSGGQTITASSSSTTDGNNVLTTTVREYKAVVKEDTPPNTLVVVFGNDQLERSAQFLIIEGNEEGRFRVNAESGEVRTALPFDRESSTEYRLVVQTIPTGFNRITAGPRIVLRIKVEDVNDNPPTFRQSQPVRFNIAETIRPNSIIGRVMVEDADEGANGRVNLSISPPNPRFSIDAEGLVRVTSRLPPQPLSYQLRIVARDAGSPPLESTITAIVRVQPSETATSSISSSAATPRTTTTTTTTVTTPANQRPSPIFRSSRLDLVVHENADGQVVGRVMARFPDKRDGTITYILKRGDPTLFAIDKLTGNIRTLKALDAETKTTHTLLISTQQAEDSSLRTSVDNTATVTIKVEDANDWIPTFDPQSYAAAVDSNVKPGTPLMQLKAMDKDLEEPNNVIGYNMTGLDGADDFFAIDRNSGLITIVRSLEEMANQDLILFVKASDGGDPVLSSTATVAVNVRPSRVNIVPDNKPDMGNRPSPPTTSGNFVPSNNRIQFSLRNYTTSVSESQRPPFFVHVLHVKNKPSDTRFVYCEIVSGNYGGAFSVSAGVEGDCELRTQVLLDRETIGQYLLNISVALEGATDYALVAITVLDANDNAPRFQYNNDLELTSYFGGVSSSAAAFSRALMVKAVDADLGNSSVVRYRLDPLSSDARYFRIDEQLGEISSEQGMAEVLKSRDGEPRFEFKVEARDSPVAGRPMVAKTDVVVVVVQDTNRFKLTAEGIRPNQMENYVTDLKNSMRGHVGDCVLLKVEKITENPEMISQGKSGTDVYWYTINPKTKEICETASYQPLFEGSTFDTIRGQMHPWFKLAELTDRVTTVGADGSSLGGGGQTKRSRVGFFPEGWTPTSIALIILAILVAVGAFLGIIAMCCFWAKYKSSRKTTLSDLPPLMGGVTATSKFGPVFLPPSEKIYETQMMELAVNEDQHMYRKNEEEGDFSIEESMYCIGTPHSNPLMTRNGSALIIPPPDYPMGHGLHHAQQKSVL